MARSSAPFPIVASFGADDAGIPANEVEEFFGRLRVPNDLKVYPNAGTRFLRRRASVVRTPSGGGLRRERTNAFLRERSLTDAG